MPDRFARLRLIQRLDPNNDCEEIFRLVTDYEFPWDYWQSASLAFFRTFGVPSIAELLHRTGEITTRTQKRADDTLLMLYEITHHGLENEHARAFLRRMNRMHQHYSISNDDHRYILALYIVVPVRWIDRYGWRRLTDHERQAMTAVGRRLGELMGIKNLPPAAPLPARPEDRRSGAQVPGGPAPPLPATLQRAPVPPGPRDLPVGLPGRGSRSGLAGRAGARWALNPLPGSACVLPSMPAIRACRSPYRPVLPASVLLVVPESRSVQ